MHLLHALKMWEDRTDVRLGSQLLGEIRGTDSLQIWVRETGITEPTRSVREGTERICELYIESLMDEDAAKFARFALDRYRGIVPVAVPAAEEDVEAMGVPTNLDYWQRIDRGSLAGAGVSMLVVLAMMLVTGWLIDFAARHVLGAY